MEVSTSVKGAVNLNALFIFISRAVHIYFPCRFRELDQQHDVSVELPSQFKSTGGEKKAAKVLIKVIFFLQGSLNSDSVKSLN